MLLTITRGTRPAVAAGQIFSQTIGDALGLIDSATADVTTPGSGAAPFIVATDFTAGPTSGGENNKGTYLSIYGFNFGTFSDYGTSNHVTIGGQEVDNYRCLENVKGAPFATLGIQCLTVQVGSTAVQALTAGTAYAVSVTVGGTGPSNPTSSGNYVAPVTGRELTFTPQPGPIYFYDFVNGSDGGDGSFASPWKNLQNSSGTTYGFKIHPGQNSSGGIVPGAHNFMRTGTYTGTGPNSHALDLLRITGTDATGATDRGPVCLGRYPGAAGANSPEVPVISGSNINGNDTTRAAETSTLYGGFTGWCKYIHISNIKVAVSASLGGHFGPINVQNSAQHWRIVNCELTWPSTQSPAQSAGIEGSAIDSEFLLNYIHDVYGDSAKENHGIYMDGWSGSGECATIRTVIAFNYIKDITHGTGVQFYGGSSNSDMYENVIAGNYIDTTGKYGINWNVRVRNGIAYNNVLVNLGEHAFVVDTSACASGNKIINSNNTVYGWGVTNSSRYAMYKNSSIGGTWLSENNIFCQSASHSANSYGFYADNAGGGTITLNDNLWYDPDGRLTTKPSGDTAGAYGNPLFTSAGTDFTLADSSPGIDSGTTPTGFTRSYGFELNAAPDGTVDRGAYERAA